MSSFVVGVAGFGLFVIVAPLILRLTPQLSGVSQQAIAAVISHVLAILVGTLYLAPLQYWHAAAAFGCLTMSYILTFGAVYKSVSLSVLVGLSQQAEGRKRLDEILVDMERILDGRIALIVESGSARSSDGFYAVTEVGRSLARTINRLRSLFGITDAGFYNFGTPETAQRDIDRH